MKPLQPSALANKGGKYAHVKSKVSAGAARAPSTEAAKARSGSLPRQGSSDRAGRATPRALSKPVGRFGKEPVGTPKKPVRAPSQSSRAGSLGGVRKTPKAERRPAPGHLVPPTSGRKTTVKPPVPRLARRAVATPKKTVEAGEPAVEVTADVHVEVDAAAAPTETPAVDDEQGGSAPEALQVEATPVLPTEEEAHTAALAAIEARLPQRTALEYIGRTRYPNHLAGGKRPGTLVAPEVEEVAVVAETKHAQVDDKDVAEDKDAPAVVEEVKDEAKAKADAASPAAPRDSVPLCVSPTTPGFTRPTLGHVVSPMSPATAASQPSPVCLQFGRTDSTLMAFSQEEVAAATVLAMGTLSPAAVRTPCAVEALTPQATLGTPLAIEAGVQRASLEPVGAPVDVELPGTPAAASPVKVADAVVEEPAVEAAEAAPVAEVAAEEERHEAAPAVDDEAAAPAAAAAEAVEEDEVVVRKDEEVIAEPQPADAAPAGLVASPAARSSVGEKRKLEEVEGGAEGEAEPVAAGSPEPKRAKVDETDAEAKDTPSVDLSALSHRDLQVMCKERGLKASGKTTELRKRLAAALRA